MRFLCLHGLGTNSNVFETQTAAIRSGLRGKHQYDFVEGVMAWPKAPELGDMFSDDENYFGYFDPKDASTFLTALECLDGYLQAEDPYDAVIAFSQGGSLFSTWALAKELSAIKNGHAWKSSFKCAIFFCSGAAVDVEALRNNEIVELRDSNSKHRISIPTAHIWAANDFMYSKASAATELLCDSKFRHSYVHNEGHQVPGRRAPEILNYSIDTIHKLLEGIDEPLV